MPKNNRETKTVRPKRLEEKVGEEEKTAYKGKKNKVGIYRKAYREEEYIE